MRNPTKTIVLLIIIFIFITCGTEPENKDLEKVDIILSGWNGKIGAEDNIITLKSNRSFTYWSTSSYIDLCGIISEIEYNNIVSRLKEMSILSVNLYHTISCTDAYGNKQTTKLIVTYLKTGKSNTIRWSECEIDQDNLGLMTKLDSFRDYVRSIIWNTEKVVCE
jgi:hypothetical protein